MRVSPRMHEAVASVLQYSINMAWQHIPIIPSLGRWRQEVCPWLHSKFKASMEYPRACFRKERGKERDRGRDGQRQTERQRQRETERQRQGKRHRQRKRDREAEKETERHT